MKNILAQVYALPTQIFWLPAAAPFPMIILFRIRLFYAKKARQVKAEVLEKIQTGLQKTSDSGYNERAKKQSTSSSHLPTECTRSFALKWRDANPKVAK
jgi:hypothetical protein